MDALEYAKKVLTELEQRVQEQKDLIKEIEVFYAESKLLNNNCPENK